MSSLSVPVCVLVNLLIIEHACWSQGCIGQSCAPLVDSCRGRWIRHCYRLSVVIPHSTTHATRTSLSITPTHQTARIHLHAHAHGTHTHTHAHSTHSRSKHTQVQKHTHTHSCIQSKCLLSQTIIVYCSRRPVSFMLFHQRYYY